MLFGVFAVPRYAFAGLGLEQAKDAAKQADFQTEGDSANLTLMVARLIRGAMGLLGAIAVVLFVYAGFLWMTAGGEEKKVGDAKTLIRQVIIGMAIILAAWALTSFVINSLVDATT